MKKKKCFLKEEPGGLCTIKPLYLFESNGSYSHAVKSKSNGNSSWGLPHVSASKWKQKILSRTSRGGTLHKMSTTTSVPLRQDILGKKLGPNLQHINCVLECRIIWPGQWTKTSTQPYQLWCLSFIVHLPRWNLANDIRHFRFRFIRFHVWF